MIRLLTAILLLTFSHFGWAMAYPEDYNGVPHGDFKEGDVIDHSKFNQNHLSIKEAINDRVPVPSNCSTNQIIKYDGGGWVCTDMPADGADGAPGADGADGADGVAAGLNCTTDQIIVYRDGAWVCSSPEVLTWAVTGNDLTQGCFPEKVTGGGCSFSGDGCFTSSEPLSDLSGWKCTASDGPYTEGFCSVTQVFAICH